MVFLNTLKNLTSSPPIGNDMMPDHQTEDMGSLPSTQPEVNDLGMVHSTLLPRKWYKDTHRPPPSQVTFGSKRVRAYRTVRNLSPVLSVTGPSPTLITPKQTQMSE